MVQSEVQILTLYLDNRRETLKLYLDDDSGAHIEESWKENLRDDATGRAWTGRIVVYRLGPPHVYYHDVTEESRLPLQARTRKDPTPEERVLHQLTHMNLSLLVRGLPMS